MNPLLLSEIQSPGDLRGRSLEELEDLCLQIRAALIEKVRRTGGHLGSNLGVVELLVALHRVFDFRRDRLVLDVSHQCYPHKMLTGRYAGFDRLRQTGGLSGFCNRSESPYDVLTAGHAGTAISFACGLAEGFRGSGGEEGDPWVVALVGDAGLGAGNSFEGLNYAGERRPRLLVVLNDNEWSIARSVGALARYLSRIRSSRTLQATYERLTDLARRIPVLGDRLDEVGEVVRHVLVPGHVFEEMGVNYVGPLDGHDLGGCIDALERVRRLDGVTMIHFLTEKGRGFAPAAEDAERAHGVKPESAKTEPAAATPRRSWTDCFGRALVAAAERDARIVAITAGMPSGTGLAGFAERFPGRFFDTGITEQHAVAMAGGLATAGRKPVAAIYSTFLQRAYDQVFQEVALQGEDVLLCLDRAGLVGQDGPTHQGLYDLAYLRALPGLTLASPRDALDLERMLAAALERGGPWALRWPRGAAPERIGGPAELRPELQPGTAERLRTGDRGAVLALGAMVEPALAAAERLAAAGIEVELWDARFCKPLDLGLIADLARRHSWLATVEEHSLNGGFGAAVAEALVDLELEQPPRLLRHGVPDRFIAHASSREEQLEECGLTPSALAAAWRRATGVPVLEASDA
ncbi:MAG: 1-deoxy-D-xylulose-5-phosphate synthase [Planctomycetota bacterium]|nr:MAG: 1-deoxy-D-xylulose-5-phosphate synthase [Planctomycetota bacterium]